MSSLSVQWKMSDPESSIVEQFVSLTTRDSVQHNVPAVKVGRSSTLSAAQLLVTSAR